MPACACAMRRPVMGFLACECLMMLNVCFVACKPYRSNIFNLYSLIVSNHMIPIIYLHCIGFHGPAVYFYSANVIRQVKHDLMNLDIFGTAAFAILSMPLCACLNLCRQLHTQMD